MLILKRRKDGGSESPVDAYFLIESKRFGSLALLKFNKGGREAYHTHAFNAWTWFLKGELVEEDVNGELYNYERSLLPKTTLKGKNHRVKADTNSWCFTLRGPWVDRWTEYNEREDETSVFTHGRRVIERLQGIQLGGESCQQSK